MATKRVTNEEILSLLDEEKVKRVIQEQIIFPRILISGTIENGKREETYRCPYCGHVWSESDCERNYYHYRGGVCPKCGKEVYHNIVLFNEEDVHRESSINYKDPSGKIFPTNKVFYMDTAVVSERKGLVLAEYNVSMEWRVTDTISIQDIELRLNCRAFLTEESKYLYNEAGKRTNMNLSNGFRIGDTMEVVSENAKKFMQECLFMNGVHSCTVTYWMDMFEKSRDISLQGAYISKGERIAQETIKRFPCEELPEISHQIKKIMRKGLSEDVITGIHSRENFCLNCGTLFCDEARTMYANSICPNCGCESGTSYNSLREGASREVCFISQEGENTLFLRIGKYHYTFDSEWKMDVAIRELYRCIMVFEENKAPEIHFLVNEGYGNDCWMEKANYGSDKFCHTIQEIQPIGKIPLLKYSALQEYLKVDQPGTGYSALKFRSLITFIRFEKMYPVGERLCKRGIVSALIDELRYLQAEGKSRYIDFTCDKVSDALKLSEHFTKILISCDGGATTLDRLQRLYTLDPNMNPENYEWIMQQGVTVEHIERIFMETPMTIMRLCEYLEHVRINQCFEPKVAISDWCDYIRAAKTIDVDLTDNKAKYPSSLKREHDRAIAKQKLVLDEKKEEFFQAETERYGKLFSYETDQYRIIPPKDMKDLFEEGRKLCHCVGSYSDRIIQGNTCILFIRKTEEPEKPYFTVEVNPQEGYVTQIRGLSNRLINRVTEKSLVEFLKEWGVKKHVQVGRAL